MDVQAETSKRIEELEKENKELREKLDKCRKLLREAVKIIGYGKDCETCCYNNNDSEECLSCSRNGNSHLTTDCYIWKGTFDAYEVLKDE